MSEEPAQTPSLTRFIRKVGPRGIEGFFGWTFFDPANLVCVGVLSAAAVLVVVSMRGRGAPDWYMPLGLYLCLAIFLRGYFFNYYNGRSLGRVGVLLVLLLSLTASAALWEDRSDPHQVLRPPGTLVTLPEAVGFHVAALLHGLAAVTLFIHALLPRGWLVRATDELADRSGRDDAPDAPPESRRRTNEQAIVTAPRPDAEDEDARSG
jgi:hypothetical protein